MVSRHCVIFAASRLDSCARASRVKPNATGLKAAAGLAPDAAPAPRTAPAPKPAPAPAPEPREAEPATAAAAPVTPAAPRPAADGPVLRSVGPGGFIRQNPGEQAPPSAPAPPRRLVPAKPSKEIEGKTSLLDLNDKICKWPLGHPGEPDFHFCGDKVNPGFPYCVAHCGHAYQAQLPRRDRRPPPPMPYGGPRVR
ncbi:GcrA cell cycle regulator [Sphingomonas koreensis]|nr:GcrA cell cycle regulator [Sphingomonas koreensis]